MSRKRRISIILSILMTALWINVPGPVLAQSDGIDSAYYGVDREANVLGQIAGGTSREELFSRVLADGELRLSGGVATGSRLDLLRNGRAADSLILAVAGDLNGDGAFSVSDLLMLRASLLGRRELSEAQRRAGDLNGDGALTETDLVRMKGMLLGRDACAPHPVAGSAAYETAVLVPGETVSFGSAWDSAAVSGDAVTWDAGTVRAMKPGSARVTVRGETLWVTVSETPLTVALPEGALCLTPGDRTALHPVLNHPVRERIEWRVSDAAVARIGDDGILTALAEGTAEISAVLPNGQTAVQTLHVLPRIRSVRFERDTVKIRHGGSVKALRPVIEPASSAEALEWISSDPDVATVDGYGNVTGHLDGFATITCVSRYGGVSASCTVKVCDLKQVALTFDDGPSEVFTGPMLDLLKEHGAHGTFFMVGGRIAKGAGLLCRMLIEGHELGYHTWSHRRLSEMTAGEIAGEFSWFQSAAKAACGQGATVFRAPYGDVRGSALGVVNVPHILWTVDTLDWLDRDPELLCEKLLEAFGRDGVIILVHDIHETTYEGVRMALEKMEEQDLDVELLTVTELLSRDGTVPKAGHTYRNAP